MINVTIPGRGNLRFDHVVLDLNGTIALDSNIIEGVQERLESLHELLDIILVTADTKGKAHELGSNLHLEVHKVGSGDEQNQKLKLVQRLGKETTVSIGNGSNDALMLKESILGICVIGTEGAAAEAIASCDVVICDINAAIDLLLNPERLIATMRK